MNSPCSPIYIYVKPSLQRDFFAETLYCNGGTSLLTKLFPLPPFRDTIGKESPQYFFMTPNGDRQKKLLVSPGTRDESRFECTRYKWVPCPI